MQGRGVGVRQTFCPVAVTLLESGSMAGRVLGWQSSVELWSVAGVNRAGGGS